MSPGDTLRKRLIIGNNNVAAKTGNTYITGTMTHKIEIPIAILGLLTMVSRTKVCTGDCQILILTVIVQEIKIFPLFGCQIIISGIDHNINRLRTVSPSLPWSKNIRFAVGISMPYDTAISILGYLVPRPYCYFRFSIIAHLVADISNQLDVLENFAFTPSVTIILSLKLFNLISEREHKISPVSN